MNTSYCMSASRRLVLLAIVALTALTIAVPFDSVEAARSKEAYEQKMENRQKAQAMAEEAAAGGARHDLGSQLPLWSCVPFVGILLSIALFPMFAPVFWHHHFPKIAFAWGLIFTIPFLIAYKGIALHESVHIVLFDYVPFIILLWGLFTVSGGILLRGTLVGKPVVNLALLFVGTVLASWMGTTGAAMLMIRPLLRANASRKYQVHTVIFFIFLVANSGGLLTPLGDPPLFLGFLRGVPFFWTMGLWTKLIVVGSYLFILYYIIDSYLYKKESHAEETDVASEAREKFGISGGHNLLILAGIVGAVLLSGSWDGGEFYFAGFHFKVAAVTRDILIVVLGLLSLWTTKREYRKANGFSWFPILEVGYLFIGIFLTIVAPLQILQAGEHGAAAPIIEAVGSPASYFWITGSLSAFLDNAPTYLTFFNLALGELGLSPQDVTPILTGAMTGPTATAFIEDLTAISSGAVFFGAVSYIGNAPNFMVRSIAEEARIPMPSFFGYVGWAILILFPIFAVMTFLYYL